MRSVAILAAILALPCGVFADEPESPEIFTPAASAAIAPAEAAATGKYDTSVFHLQHTRARQIIPAVKQALLKSLTSAKAEQPNAHAVVSVVFMPTTSDDALVAICPREDAALVKEAIERCDVERQYAVRVQLFEIAANGQAVPVGEPGVVVGREGSVECKMPGNGAVTVNLQVSDAVTPAAVLSTQPVATEAVEEPSCGGPDCGQPAAECSASKGACPASCSGNTIAAATCPACCNGKAIAAATCPACSNGKCSGSCSVQSVASNCKSGVCKSEGASSCKCTSSGSCNCESADSCTCGSGCTCEDCGESSSPSELLTAKDYQLLVRILANIWLQEHQEHAEGNGSIVKTPAELEDCCPGHELKAATDRLIAPTSGIQTRDEKSGVDLGCPAQAAPAAEAPAENNHAMEPYDDTAPVPAVQNNTEFERLFIGRVHTSDDGFRIGGVYRLGRGDHDDDVAVTRVTDSDDSDCTLHGCGTSSCQGPSTEPPALLTLAPRKDNSSGLGVVIAPRWQAELSKIYQGRRLSEIFESHNGSDAGAAALGRLLAEIPKPACECEGDNARHHNVIVVDMPDRIRVFESPSQSVAPAASCTNCREQFRTLLEEIFRGSNGLEEIAQTGHAQDEPAVAEPPRDLPSVAHSKLDTTVVTYPLHDLVLLDDAERPVFDTCTIIDHIQAAVAPESWWHPSVSIQLDQQSMSLVIRQSPDVHKKIEAHLRDLRRLQLRQLSKLVERLSAEPESSDD